MNVHTNVVCLFSFKSCIEQIMKLSSLFLYNFVLRLTGIGSSVIITGKVHGSLARAGKVRGQTPKVDKQDKKKLPKGRAMKRLKYTRRFVNVGKYITIIFLCVNGDNLLIFFRWEEDLMDFG